MDLSPVIAHLKGRLTGVRQIGTIADLAAAADGLMGAPAVFVLPASERSCFDDQDGGYDLQLEFSVVCVVSNRRDAVGSAAQVDLAALRQRVRSALDSLILPGAQVPPTFVAGALQTFSDQLLWWADDFTVFVFD